MGSNWWKFHSHVRINNINIIIYIWINNINIIIYIENLYIYITMINTDCSIFPRRPEDRSRSPHGVDTLRCTSREIPETPRNARHSDALGCPGMLAALHLQDLRVSDCTWEIRIRQKRPYNQTQCIKPLQSSNLWVTKLQRPGNAVEHSALARVYALDTIALPIARTDIVSLQKARKFEKLGKKCKKKFQTSRLSMTKYD